MSAVGKEKEKEKQPETTAYEMQKCLGLEESCCFCMTQKVWHGRSSITGFEKLPQCRIRMTNPPFW